jgi:hypothetical protein
MPLLILKVLSLMYYFRQFLDGGFPLADSKGFMGDIPGASALFSTVSGYFPARVWASARRLIPKNGSLLPGQFFAKSDLRFVGFCISSTNAQYRLGNTATDME